jgi:hypothetical protein
MVTSPVIVSPVLLTFWFVILASVTLPSAILSTVTAWLAILVVVTDRAEIEVSVTALFASRATGSPRVEP